MSKNMRVIKLWKCKMKNKQEKIKGKGARKRKATKRR